MLDTPRTEPALMTTGCHNDLWGLLVNVKAKMKMMRPENTTMRVIMLWETQTQKDNADGKSPCRKHFKHISLYSNCVKHYHQLFVSNSFCRLQDQNTAPR